MAKARKAAKDKERQKYSRRNRAEAAAVSRAAAGGAPAAAAPSAAALEAAKELLGRIARGNGSSLYPSTFPANGVLSDEQQTAIIQAIHEHGFISEEDEARIWSSFLETACTHKGPLKACAACGVRNVFEQATYKERAVSELSVFQCCEAAQVRLRSMPSVKLMRADGTEVECQLRNVHGVWRAPGPNSRFYHLHPDLVRTDATGAHHVDLCGACNTAASRKTPAVTDRSLAAGIDYGSYHNLCPENDLADVLPPLRMVEIQLMAPVREYHVVEKVVVNNNVRHKLMSHCISFFANGPAAVATNLANLYDPEKNGFYDYVRVLFVVTATKPDILAKKKGLHLTDLQVRAALEPRLQASHCASGLPLSRA